MMDRGSGWPHWVGDDRDGPTIAARVPVRPDVEPISADDVVRSILQRMWRRAFWAGVCVGGLLTGAAFIAGAAWSLDISGSTVTLQPSADPAAFADVVFANDLSNGPHDTGSYTLSQDGLVVGVRFTWDANFIGMDRIVVTPPPGMICAPADCSATVVEGQVGRITLYPWQGA